MPRGQATLTPKRHRSCFREPSWGRIRKQLSYKPEGLPWSHHSRWSRLEVGHRPCEGQARDGGDLQGQKGQSESECSRKRGYQVIPKLHKIRSQSTPNPDISHVGYRCPGDDRSPRKLTSPLPWGRVTHLSLPAIKRLICFLLFIIWQIYI